MNTVKNINDYIFEEDLSEIKKIEFKNKLLKIAFILLTAGIVLALFHFSLTIAAKL